MDVEIAFVKDDVEVYQS